MCQVPLFLPSSQSDVQHRLTIDMLEVPIMHERYNVLA
jgi:hypothetical protein